jgi:hypothetical protein
MSLSAIITHAALAPGLTFNVTAVHGNSSFSVNTIPFGKRKSGGTLNKLYNTVQL